MATATDARTAQKYSEDQLKFMKAQQKQQSLISKLGLPLMLIAPWLAAKALPAMLLKMGMGAEKIAAITGMTQTAAGVGEAAKWTALPAAELGTFAKHMYKPLVHGTVGSLPGLIAKQVAKPLDLEFMPKTGRSLPGLAGSAATAGFLEQGLGQFQEQKQAAAHQKYLGDMRSIMGIDQGQVAPKGPGSVSPDSVKQASKRYSEGQDWVKQARRIGGKTSRYGG